MRRGLGRLLDGLGAGYVNDLNHGNPGQSFLQIAMRVDGEMIADLDRVRPAEALLLDDLGNPLSRSQEECSDCGWDCRGNFCDPLIADDAGPARHVRNQSQRGGSTLNGQSRFINTADAADFYSWRARRSNEISSVFPL